MRKSIIFTINMIYSSTNFFLHVVLFLVHVAMQSGTAYDEFSLDKMVNNMKIGDDRLVRYNLPRYVLIVMHKIRAIPKTGNLPDLAVIS